MSAGRRARECRLAEPDGVRPAPLPALEALFESNLLQHRRALSSMPDLRAPACAAARLMLQALRRGGRLLFFGNGGSASDSQHLTAEFNGRLARERAPLAAMALNADTASLTAIANDYGYAEVFARQLQAQGRPGDCAVAVSTSGESENVVRALHTARRLGLSSVALLGRTGGRARGLVDVAVVVPHADSARIQEMHIFIGHTWCGQIERGLGLVV